MEDQTPGWWRVDGPTFTALQRSVTDFHAVLAWLLHPPRSEERVDAFARVFPIVAQLEALLAAIVQEKVPEAGEYLDAIQAAIEKMHANITAGDITSAEAQRILAELDQRRERMLARTHALVDQTKGQEAAGPPPSSCNKKVLLSMGGEIERVSRLPSPRGEKHMARPHENTTLTTACANPECRKVIATEYPFSEGFTIEEAGHRRTVSACRACVDRGWRPPGYRGF